ncbi:MAG: pilus assembly protein [Gemmatales bacterium]|nr:pilus assembly protein [Gemmatales bacterium]MDW8385912.1 pilus assembly protein [Gemmatales bacterium]
MRLKRFGQREARRRGSVTVEMTLLFPVVLLLFLGMIEFSMMLHARQQLLAASREGARVAALGGDLDEVRQAVRLYLGNGRLGDADVRLTATSSEPVQDVREIPSGEPVEVWVSIPAGYVVPDLLRIVGYSIRNEELVARTVMRKE